MKFVFTTTYAAMAAKSKPSLTEDVQSVTLCTARPLLLHGYVAPFVILYGIWLYVWTVIYGASDYFEAGLIALAIVGLLQILCCLSCHWSVDVRVALTCYKVNLETKVIYC